MPKQTNASNDLMRYAGLGAQILVSIGIAVFIGLKLDQWINMQLPMIVCLMTLVVVSLTIYKFIKEKSNKK